MRYKYFLLSDRVKICNKIQNSVEKLRRYKSTRKGWSRVNRDKSCKIIKVGPTKGDYNNLLSAIKF